MDDKTKEYDETPRQPTTARDLFMVAVMMSALCNDTEACPFSAQYPDDFPDITKED